MLAASLPPICKYEAALVLKPCLQLGDINTKAAGRRHASVEHFLRCCLKKRLLLLPISTEVLFVTRRDHPIWECVQDDDTWSKNVYFLAVEHREMRIRVVGTIRQFFLKAFAGIWYHCKPDELRSKVDYDRSSLEIEFFASSFRGHAKEVGMPGVGLAFP